MVPMDKPESPRKPYAASLTLIAVAFAVVGGICRADEPPAKRPKWMWVIVPQVHPDGAPADAPPLQFGDMVSILQEKSAAIRVRHADWIGVPQEGWVAADALVGEASAVDYFSSVLDCEPRNARAHYALATAFVNVDAPDVGLAIGSCAEAIRLDPTFAEAYVGRALLHRQMGRFLASLADLSNAARLRPNDVRVRLLRLEDYLRVGEYASAFAEASEVVRLDPANAAGYVQRAEAAVGIGNYHYALMDIEKARQLDQDARVDECEAMAWIGKGENDRAMTYFTQQVDAGANDGTFSPVTLRGILWARKGEFKKAASDFARKDEHFGSPVDPCFDDDQRAWFYATCPDSQFRDGKAALRMARAVCLSAALYSEEEVLNRRRAREPNAVYDTSWVGTKWRRWWYFETLAAALAETGQFATAAMWQEKAMQLAPLADWHVLKSRLDLYRNNTPLSVAGCEADGCLRLPANKVHELWPTKGR